MVGWSARYNPKDIKKVCRLYERNEKLYMHKIP
jgi:hypothetical protein